MFDLAKFDAVKIGERTAEIPVPGLKQFFAPDENPVWTVRALSGLESAHAREAIAQNRSIHDMIIKIATGSSEDKIQAVLDMLGVVSDTVPDDYVWRISCLRQGSVNPKIDHGQAVRLAEMDGQVFYLLTNKILELTGMGKHLGE